MKGTQQHTIFASLRLKYNDADLMSMYNLGGVGGFDVVTPKMHKIKVSIAGINQTQFIVIMSSAFLTNNGVTP